MTSIIAFVYRIDVPPRSDRSKGIAANCLQPQVAAAIAAGGSFTSPSHKIGDHFGNGFKHALLNAPATDLGSPDCIEVCSVVFLDRTEPLCTARTICIVSCQTGEAVRCQ